MKVYSQDFDTYEVGEDNVKRYVTDFICDDADEIPTSDSEMFKYPAGSTIYCTANGKVYVLNAAQNEFVEVE